jgi:hypothetical protein
MLKSPEITILGWQCLLDPSKVEVAFDKKPSELIENLFDFPLKCSLRKCLQKSGFQVVENLPWGCTRAACPK